MEHKKYKKIVNLRTKYQESFNKGDKVVIQEKIDGSNGSLLYDGNKMHAFSRRLPLDEFNNLNGFWQYAQTVKKVEELKGLRLFGEWLVKHTIPYSKDAYDRFYLFDVYDDSTNEYLPQEKVVEVSKLLDIPLAEVFYEGEFESWEHAHSFVGKSALGESGEGVILKNQDRLNDPNWKNPFYIKLVVPSFQERKATKGRRPTDPAVLAQREYDIGLVESIVTEPRVRKQLFVLMEDGIIPQDFDLEDMGTIARNIGKLVYDDCVEEEPDVVAEVGKDFGKHAVSVAMKIAREIVMNS